jgi:GxxExxY protein
MHLPIPCEVESVAKEIVDISFQIHKEVGPGLLESVYEKCFVHELMKRGIPFQTQVTVPIYYQGELVSDEGLKIDILVAGSIIVELKAQDNFHPVWKAQLISYLKLTKTRLGFLINFHVQKMSDGISRIIV